MSSLITKETDELKKLIAENPDLPIVVLAGSDANDGESSWTYDCGFCDGAFRAKRELASKLMIHENNDPLTMDELLKMNGEPVWIKLFDPDEEFWVLRNEWVDTRNPEPMILFRMRWYSHSDYGKTWLAYRQKPEEGTV